MKFIILAYHPHYVKMEELERLAEELKYNHGCYVHVVAHLNKEAEPLYCVQFVDTTMKEGIR